MNIQPVILSGGAGTRLWPLSRKSLPKQFHRFTSEKTLIQETALLLAKIPHALPPVVVCSYAHRFLMQEQLKEVNVSPSFILLEPCGRNTAAAAALAAFSQQQENPLLLICPSDHLIEDAEGFIRTIQEGAPLAANNCLVTFGVPPTHPSIEYGYIKQQGTTIAPFIEKPPLETAKTLYCQQGWYWNSGIFFFRSSTFLEELNKHAPEIYHFSEKSFFDKTEDLGFIRAGKDAFEQCPSLSIDYAVMEKSTKGAIVPAQFRWSDIGSWESLWNHAKKNPQGTAHVGNVEAIDSENCYLHSTNKLLVTIGVKNAVVINTEDATLVLDKQHAGKIKAAIETLTQQMRKELDEHKKQYRPWGYYESLVIQEGYQVKKIVVNPGCKLSLQYHRHRAEHWVVVKGTAKVTRGSDEFFLQENESTYIPLQEIHRLENPGTTPLEMIEVQSGSYLGEDDIVRLADDYNRSCPCQSKTQFTTNL